MASPASTPSSSGNVNAQGYTQAAVFMLALVMALSFLAGREGSGRRFVPDKWLNKDGTFYFLTLRTLWDKHTLSQDDTQPRSWYEQNLGWNNNLPPDWSDVAIGRDGRYYPKHPILLPVATLPFFWAFDAYGALLINVLCLVLLPVFAYRIARRMAPWGAAAAAAALFASSDYLSGQAYGYSNDLFTGILVVVAFERAFAGAAGLAGLFFGLSVFAKATDAVFLPGLALVFVMNKDWRGLMRAAIFAAVPIAIFAALNWWMYGAPWHTGYNHILFRQNGMQAYHDHGQDFDWANYGRHLLDVLWHPGQFGMYDRAFFWLFALPGAVVALVRAPKLAVPLLLGIVAPVLVLAPFKYFRVEFLDGAVGLSMGFIAALLVPWAKAPSADDTSKSAAAGPGQVRWDRLGPVAALGVLLISGVVRAAIPSHEGYFNKQLTSARATLGQIPCDYFNWQVQRWECSNYDQGRDELMIGRSLVEKPRFGGKPQNLIEMSPHPSHQPKRLTYEGLLWGDKLQIHYGLRDGSMPRGHESFVVYLNDQPHPLALGNAGELLTEDIDTSAMKGQVGKVAFEITSDAPIDAGVYFDGGPI
jgi:hypothetical protein